MPSSKQKLSLNTFTSLLFQITTMICGFILPRLILGCYGSAVNGLVSSITQFLSLITFLELGIGAVIQSALYKPLAEQNNAEISAIITSGSKFFKWIALVLAIYVCGLMGIYPIFVNQDFDWLYSASLIAVICVSSFAQYYFGIVDCLLLKADQRVYIQNIAFIITMILNTAACAILIKCGASIHTVKLATSILHLLRPLALRAYVNKHYHINRRQKYDKEPIKQKWNGIAQHVAAVVLGDTDIIVLTVLSTLPNISIYSVYNLVVMGVKNLCTSAISGVQSLMGELWAKQKLETLNEFFDAFEFCLHATITFIFSCTAILIVPFVQVYTNGVTDADYIQPIFAVLLTAAHAGHCLRMPYNLMILAAGHYKQTQSNYIIVAILNIVISVVFVWRFGLVGVAIGTLIAMLYQTVWMAYYNSKNLIHHSIRKFWIQMGFDAVAVLLIFVSTFWIELASLSYMSWVLMACKVSAIALCIVATLSWILYRKQVLYIFSKIKMR